VSEIVSSCAQPPCAVLLSVLAKRSFGSVAPCVDQKLLNMTPCIWALPSVIAWSKQLLDSFHHWTGRDLLARSGPIEDQARALFDASFVVVSHGTEPDPILNYGNQTALDLWEMTWDRLTCTPSHQTAEPMNRAERARMLQQVDERGYYDRYRGVRISATGRRFLVEDAVVWTVMDAQGRSLGQAATFSRWSRVS
jgi:MEKHLA domain